MLNIKLNCKCGYRWFYNEGVNSRGYFFDNNNRLFSHEQTVDYFADIADENAFIQYIRGINGFFAVVINRNDKIFAAVDRLRGFPLFYSQVGGDLYLSDDAYWIREMINAPLQEEAEYELLSGISVAGADTLCKSIKQIQAGECLIFDNGKITTKRYFQYRHAVEFTDDGEALIERLDNVHANVVARLIKYLNGRTAVIPLSGGYDSRLLAVMLKKLGYEDVVCFSYGRLGNQESKVSQEVAKYLGYQWLFIPSSRKLWYEWFHSDKRLAFAKYADGLCTNAHLQDWPVVWKLKEAKMISDDAVFVPGHSADFLEGSHLPAWLDEKKCYSQQTLLDAIYHKHYLAAGKAAIVREKVRQFVESKIFNVIEKKEFYSAAEFADGFECFDWQERQAKFICNSVRVYEFWGYQWAMPLWDNEMMDYWSKIPVDLRVNRKLYFQYIEAKQKIPIKSSNALGRWYYYYNKIFEPYYGQFNGKYPLIKSLLMKNHELFDNVPNPIVPAQDFVYRTEPNTLANWNRLNEIKAGII